jgi:hypothetical protein
VQLSLLLGDEEESVEVLDAFSVFSGALFVDESVAAEPELLDDLLL